MGTSTKKPMNREESSALADDDLFELADSGLSKKFAELCDTFRVVNPEKGSVSFDQLIPLLQMFDEIVRRQEIKDTDKSDLASITNAIYSMQSISQSFYACSADVGDALVAALNQGKKPLRLYGLLDEVSVEPFDMSLLGSKKCESIENLSNREIELLEKQVRRLSFKDLGNVLHYYNTGPARRENAAMQILSYAALKYKIFEVLKNEEVSVEDKRTANHYKTALVDFIKPELERLEPVIWPHDYGLRMCTAEPVLRHLYVQLVYTVGKADFFQDVLIHQREQKMMDIDLRDPERSNKHTVAKVRAATRQRG